MSAPETPPSRPRRARRSSSVPALLVAVLSLAPIALHAADGEALSATCVACHGEDGLATAANYPILAGQYESYLEQALLAYRSGARQNAIMAGFATQLSDEDIAALAAYYAALPGPLQTTRSD